MAHVYYCQRCRCEMTCSQPWNTCPACSPGYSAQNAICGRCANKDAAQAIRTTAGLLSHVGAYTRKELLAMADEIDPR